MRLSQTFRLRTENGWNKDARQDGSLGVNLQTAMDLTTKNAKITKREAGKSTCLKIRLTAMGARVIKFILCLSGCHT